MDIFEELILSLFIILFMYLYIFGCARSLLLHGLFSGSSAWTPHCSCFSRCGASGFRAARLQELWFPCSIAQAQSWWHTDLVVAWYVEPSRISHWTPALAGRFFTTEPPLIPFCLIFFLKEWFSFRIFWCFLMIKLRLCISGRNSRNWYYVLLKVSHPERMILSKLKKKITVPKRLNIPF